MNESTKWRKFLQPVIAGLALFLAAATTAMQRTDSDSADSRLTALEVKTDALEEQHKAYNADMSVMREALSVIRSDVAFIRGKMEGAADYRRK